MMCYNKLMLRLYKQKCTDSTLSLSLSRIALDSTSFLLALTILSGLILSSSSVSAEDVVDIINITVPVSCTISGTGMNTHNAEINNGTYTPNIGTTTIHAFCNDAGGFAIYAAGYTGDEIGGTNSNKLVGTSASSNATIDTGLATSAGNLDVSNWAMKLAITQDSGDTTGTNAFTIDSAPNTSGGADASFSQYHVVPNEYTKVAHKNSATDMTANTGGVKLTTTYAAYISKTQPADTYTGQVIYTLVHPHNAPEPVAKNQVGITYDGNGLYFDQGKTKSSNRVIYEYQCNDQYGYVGGTAGIIKTDNVSSDGETQNGAYNDGTEFYDQIGNLRYEGASKLKIVLKYELSVNTSVGIQTQAYELYDTELYHGSSTNRSGEGVYIVEGSFVRVYLDVWGAPSADYDYGLFMEVYPIYDEPTEGASYEYVNTPCSFIPVKGQYEETTTWYDYWYNPNNSFSDEDRIIKYLLNPNRETLSGTNITVYAYYPYFIKYNGNGATAGTMEGFDTIVNNMLDRASQYDHLTVPNFYKTGYGFAGWSSDQNASVNGNSVIYGPNVQFTRSDFAFDSITHEHTLYAVWVQSSGDMQNWGGCASLTDGQVIALTDNRDNNVYTVGKMQDDNCWMMENLRLDSDHSSDNTKAQGFGGVFSGLADSEDDFSNATTSNSLYSTTNITGSNQSRRIPRYNNNRTNIGGTNVAGDTLVPCPGESFTYRCSGINSDYSNGQWYGRGNLYSWAAAKANTSDLTSVSSSESAETSICPKGWKLPYGRNTGNGAVSGSFSYLDIRLGGTGNDQSVDWEDFSTPELSSKWRDYPNNFVGSDFASGTSLGGNNYSNYYWSSTAYDGSRAYALYFTMVGSYTMLKPGTGYTYKNNGAAVRCLTLGS